jgi:D-glycero-alpha-D-manno-heptose 1-phosphate guanylyltransferase
MDTGGAIAYAVKTLDLKDEFLMTNADTWLGGGIFDLMQTAAPSIAVVNLDDVSRYGQVHFDHAQRVSAFVEKNDQCAVGGSTLGCAT